jgi:hypothetical protein
MPGLPNRGRQTSRLRGQDDDESSWTISQTPLRSWTGFADAMDELLDQEKEQQYRKK